MSADAPPVPNPFLTGNYAPIHDELTDVELEVIGEIPRALRGGYLRNGANPAFPPLGRYHIFDGDGMVHAVELADGRARYRNRWIESAALGVERKAGRALYGGLSEFHLPDPEVVAEGGIYKNTANTNIIRHADRYLALMEGAHPTELTRQLDTVGEFTFGGALQGPMTAHPKWDPSSGELVFFGYSPIAPYLRVHVADAGGALVRSEVIELPRCVMMHDFAVTGSSIVIFDLPAVFDLDRMLAGGTSITWEPQHGARIGVLPRDGGNDDVTWIEVDPFYVFHFLNAYDDADGTIVVDGCRSPRLPTAFGDEVLDEPVQPTLHRWRIDPVAGTVATSQLDDRPGDFPRINDEVATRANRFGYMGDATAWEGDLVQFTGVVKYDLEAGTSEVHHYGDDCEAGEPVFAPDPDGTAEDDGWLLDYVFDRTTASTELRIVDARAMGSEPVARIRLPRRVPFGFHGNWMPDPT